MGQFELGLVIDFLDGTLRPMAAIGIGPNVARTTGTAPLTTDAWHHLAFSADGAQLRLYVDGQQAGFIDYLADINAPGIPWISIGSRLVTDRTVTPNTIAPDATNPNFMFGRLDDIGLWTRALTAEEVTKIYQAGLQGQNLSTVVITPVVDPEIIDMVLSGGNVTITWTGGGTLYSSPTMAPGSWVSTGDSDGSYTTPAGTGNAFFRVER